MRKISPYKDKIMLLLPVAIIFGMIALNAVGYAADKPSTLAYDKHFYEVVKVFLDDLPAVAKTVSVIFVSITGMMALFGDYNHMKSLRILFGIAIVTHVAVLFSGGLMDVEGLVKWPEPDKPDASVIFQGFELTKCYMIIGQFMSYFESICVYGAWLISGTASKILAALVVIDVTVTMIFKLSNDHFQYLMQQCIRVGFFIWLINNWAGGQVNIAQNIVGGFKMLGIEASGVTDYGFSVSHTLGHAVDMINVMFGETTSSTGGSEYLKTGKITSLSPLVFLVSALLTIASVILIGLLAIEMVVTNVEFWIFVMFSIVFIPFGAYSATRFLFEKVIGGVFTIGIKVGLLTFLLHIITPILLKLIEKFKEPNSFTGNIGVLLGILFTVIVLYMLVKQAPQMAAGLLSGSPSLGGGGSLMGAAASVKAGLSKAAGVPSSVKGAIGTVAGGAAALAALGSSGGGSSSEEGEGKGGGDTGKDAAKGGGDGRSPSPSGGGAPGSNRDPGGDGSSPGGGAAGGESSGGGANGGSDGGGKGENLDKAKETSKKAGGFSMKTFAKNAGLAAWGATKSHLNPFRSEEYYNAKNSMERYIKAGKDTGGSIYSNADERKRDQKQNAVLEGMKDDMKAIKKELGIKDDADKGKKQDKDKDKD